MWIIYRIVVIVLYVQKRGASILKSVTLWVFGWVLVFVQMLVSDMWNWSPNQKSGKQCAVQEPPSAFWLTGKLGSESSNAPQFCGQEASPTLPYCTAGQRKVFPISPLLERSVINVPLTSNSGWMCSSIGSKYQQIMVKTILKNWYWSIPTINMLTFGVCI